MVAVVTTGNGGFILIMTGRSRQFHNNHLCNKVVDVVNMSIIVANGRRRNNSSGGNNNGDISINI